MIAELEGGALDLKRRIREGEETVAERERHIADLKRKVSEVEKARFVVEHRMQELRRQGEPRDAEVVRLKAALLVRARMLRQGHWGGMNRAGRAEIRCRRGARACTKLRSVLLLHACAALTAHDGEEMLARYQSSVAAQHCMDIRQVGRAYHLMV